MALHALPDAKKVAAFRKIATNRFVKTKAGVNLKAFVHTHTHTHTLLYNSEMFCGNKVLFSRVAIMGKLPVYYKGNKKN